MKRSLVIVATILISMGLLTGEISAQKKKKTVRKKRTSTATKTVPQPVAQQPEIVSRASDSSNQSISDAVQPGIGQTENPSQVPPRPETLDEKLDRFNQKMTELSERLGSLEGTQRNDIEAKQKRLLMNLDILTRAEQRAENLRRQVFEFLEKEASFQSRLNKLGYEMRPEVIQSNLALYGSMRPEEVREERRKELESERSSAERLLAETQRNRLALEENLASADALVKRVREKLEAEIDAALDEDKPK
jgi:Skp family chaperone for outer membrane proteins